MYYNSLFILLLFLFAGCNNKKSIDCYKARYKVPAYVAFIGVDPSDIDTIFINRYIGDNSFSQLNKSDTIINATPFQIGDTIYASEAKDPFAGLEKGWDYEIIAANSSRIFRLQNLQYNNDSVEHWIDERDCQSGTFLHLADSITVDGTVTSLYYVSNNRKFVFLKP